MLIKENQTLKVNASTAVEIITKTFYNTINNHSINLHPSIFLEGKPGVGKSQSIRQVVENLKEMTGKNINLIDIRLLLFNPIDLRGLPIADEQKRVAIWLKPEILKLKDDEDNINILFLDELTSAARSVQVAAYQIALDKKIGEHIIPDNTFVIAAGNKRDDGSVTNEMPSPLKNRFMHLEIITNYTSWKAWALKNNIHKDIIAFLDSRPKFLSDKNTNIDSNIIVTPRSWEMLSLILNFNGGGIKENELLSKMIIGNDLVDLILEQGNVYLLTTILNKEANKTESLSEITTITDLLEENIEFIITKEEYVIAMIEYIDNFPADFVLRIFKTLNNNLKNASIDIYQLDVYKELVKKMGEYLRDES